MMVSVCAHASCPTALNRHGSTKRLPASVCITPPKEAVPWQLSFVKIRTLASIEHCTLPTAIRSPYLGH